MTTFKKPVKWDLVRDYIVALPPLGFFIPEDVIRNVNKVTVLKKGTLVAYLSFLCKTQYISKNADNGRYITNPFKKIPSDLTAKALMVEASTSPKLVHRSVNFDQDTNK